MKKFVLAAALATAIAMPAVAAHAEGIDGLYVAPKLMYNLQHFQTSGKSINHCTYDSSFGGALALGWNLKKVVDQPFRFELEYAASSNASQTLHKKGHKLSIDTKEGVQTVMINGYYDITNFYGFTPYVGMGAGVAVVHNKISFSDGSNGGSHSKAVFACQVGLGVSYDITENLAVDLGYRFVRMGDGYSVKGTYESEDNYDNQIMLGARYTF